MCHLCLPLRAVFPTDISHSIISNNHILIIIGAVKVFKWKRISNYEVEIVAHRIAVLAMTFVYCFLSQSAKFFSPVLMFVEGL